MHRGYVKLWRRLEDNPLFLDPDALALWIRMLLKATHKPMDGFFNGQRITLQPGQFISGRNRMATESGVQSDKVGRLWRRMVSAQQITQQNDNRSSLISITKWENYQAGAQQNAFEMHSRCTADAHITRTLEQENNTEGDKSPELAISEKDKAALEMKRKKAADKKVFEKEFHENFDEICKIGPNSMDHEPGALKAWIAFRHAGYSIEQIIVFYRNCISDKGKLGTRYVPGFCKKTLAEIKVFVDKRWPLYLEHKGRSAELEARRISLEEDIMKRNAALEGIT